MCVECGFIRVSCLSYSTNNNNDNDIVNNFVPNCCRLTKALIDFFYSKIFFNIFFYSLIGVDSASQVSGARQIIRRYFEITNQNKNKT